MTNSLKALTGNNSTGYDLPGLSDIDRLRPYVTGGNSISMKYARETLGIKDPVTAYRRICEEHQTWRGV